MEIVSPSYGVVVLSTLFHSCIKCFETFLHRGNLERDLTLLRFRLDFEKTQILLWGSSSGILKVKEGERHESLANPETCKLAEKALKAIQKLLSDADLLQHRYGLRHTATTMSGRSRLAAADPLSSNSMNVFRISWIRFCSRAANVLPDRSASSNNIERLCWTIHDKSRFMELLDAISILVADLHKVIPVQNSEYIDLRNDLAAILDVSQLKLIEAALRSSSNSRAKDLAAVASIIISNSEHKTVDRRTISDWLQDMQTTEVPNRSNHPTAPAPEPPRLNLSKCLNFLERQYEKHRSIYIVNTPPCRNLGKPIQCPSIPAADLIRSTCEDGAENEGETFFVNGPSSTRALFPSLNKTSDFQPYKYSQLLHAYHEEGNSRTLRRLNELCPFSIIYVHTSPCACAIDAATRIASAFRTKEIDAVVRVDDRISCSCFRSSADDCIPMLRDMLEELDSFEPEPLPYENYIDRLWLDQRLFSLESEVEADDGGDPDLTDMFSLENFQDSFAGVIIVGEVEFCARLLRAEPFPGMPRGPREAEVYEIGVNEKSLRRQYVGRFALARRAMDARMAVSRKRRIEDEDDG